MIKSAIIKLYYSDQAMFDAMGAITLIGLAVAAAIISGGGV